MTNLTVGIIGAGSVGKRHAAAFSSLAAEAGLIGVVDTDGNRAAGIAGEIGTKHYTDYRELLSQKPDLVVVCTPHFLHREIGEAAAKAGCHILMEKPLAHTLEDAVALAEVCQKENVKLAVSFLHRYRQELKRAQQLISTGEIGALEMSVDIFGNPGDADDLPLFVLNCKAPVRHPAHRAVRANDAIFSFFTSAGLYNFFK